MGKEPMGKDSGPLARVPAPVAFLVVIALFTAGVLIDGWPGAAVLGVLAVLLGALLVVTWPRLQPGERALRALVLLVLIAVAISVWR